MSTSRSATTSRFPSSLIRGILVAGALCFALVFSGGLAVSAGAASKAKTVTITIKNFAFSPSHVTVKPGETIKVINKDAVTHTLTSMSKKFNTGDIASGATKSFKAPSKAGKYPYDCQIHQFMTGTLKVS